MKVSDLAPDDRPREKLLAKGAASLSDAELLAVLLRTGRAGEPVLELARNWLAEAGGLSGLAEARIGEILSRPGIKAAKGAAVAAALEVGRRLVRRRLEARSLLDRPELAAEYLASRHADERVELFGCLTLDGRHRLRREHVLHRGGRTNAQVEPAEVFHAAIGDNASSLILWHTHPSGDPSPSDDDLALTRQLVAAGTVLNIRVLDHLVLVRGGFVSLRQRGVMPS